MQIYYITLYGGGGVSKIDIYLLYNIWTAPNRGSKKLVPGEPQVVPISTRALVLKLSCTGLVISFDVCPPKWPMYMVNQRRDVVAANASITRTR